MDHQDLVDGVNAANAAAAALDLANIEKAGGTVHAESWSSLSSSGQQQHQHPETMTAHLKKISTATSSRTHRRNRRQLPLKTRSRGGSELSDDFGGNNNSKSSINEKEEEQIRERARAAASARNPLGNNKKNEKPKSKPGLLMVLHQNVRTEPWLNPMTWNPHPSPSANKQQPSKDGQSKMGVHVRPPNNVY